MSSTNYVLASIPLLFPAWIAIELLENPLNLAKYWVENFNGSKQNLASSSSSNDGDIEVPSVSSQLLVYSAMGVFGYLLTNRLVPSIKVRIYIITVIICFTNVPKRECCHNSPSPCISFIFLMLKPLSCQIENLTIGITHCAYRNIHFEKESAGKI